MLRKVKRMRRINKTNAGKQRKHLANTVGTTPAFPINPPEKAKAKKD